MEPPNIFFDVDYTLVMGDGRLRNHAEDVFIKLHERGHPIYIWSGVGIRRFDMRYHGLHGYVTDYFVKPTYRYVERLAELGVTIEPHFVIDDHREVVESFGGYYIPDFAKKDDRELLNVLESFEEFVAQWESTGEQPEPELRGPQSWRDERPKR